MFRLKTSAVLVCLMTGLAFSQSTPAPGPAPASGQSAQQPSRPAAANAINLEEYVAAQFGPAFTVLPKFGVLAGDLDGDGAEDLVLAATAKNPLLDEAEFHYRTIDPYNTFYGFGDPRVTLQFSSQEGQPRYLLIVHDWHAATPKAKFVVINLPFEKLALARIAIKKKVVPCVAAEDRTGQVSSVYWNGKQYKWVDTDMAQP